MSVLAVDRRKSPSTPFVLVGQKECFEEEVTDFGVRPLFGGRYINIPRKNSLADQPMNCKCCLIRNDIKLVGFCRPTTG